MPGRSSSCQDSWPVWLHGRRRLTERYRDLAVRAHGRVRSTQTRAQACSSWASKVLAQASAGSQRLEDGKPPDLVEWKPVVRRGRWSISYSLYYLPAPRSRESQRALSQNRLWTSPGSRSQRNRPRRVLAAMLPRTVSLSKGVPVLLGAVELLPPGASKPRMAQAGVRGQVGTRNGFFEHEPTLRACIVINYR